jgi:hypothetical protein
MNHVMNPNGKWYIVSIDLFSDPNFDSFEYVCPHQPQSKGFFELQNLKSIFHPFGKPSWSQPSASITTTIHGFLFIDESNKRKPHLNKHTKYDPVNLDKLIWTMGGLFYLQNVGLFD